jgi:putative methyltransferase (TIGR04325 family)
MRKLTPLRRPSAKKIIRALAPPALLDLGKEVRRRVRREVRPWEYVAMEWPVSHTSKPGKGWDVTTIPKLHGNRWQEFAATLKGPGPLSLAPEHFVNPDLDTSPYRDLDVLLHHSIMTYAYVLAQASRSRTSMSMLDWGGGIGHYYLISRTLFPDLDLDYSVKDLPAMAAEGRQVLPGVTFYDDEQCFGRTYDFVMASGSVQYSEQWREALARFGRHANGYLFVSQIPIVHDTSSFVAIQRPYAHGYNTEYFGWCFQRQELLEAARIHGLELVREFLHGFKPIVHRAPERPEYRSYLFRPAADQT